MAARFDVAKVLVGAFAVPWWNRRAFARALALPVVSLATFTTVWYHAARSLPSYSGWAACLVWGLLFVWFAVTCHRLVLLDAATVASRLAPRWSRRETRFLLCLVGAWLACLGVFLLVAMGLANVAIWVLPHKPEDVPLEWVEVAGRVPAYYVFARLSLVFPATAIDRDVDFRWAWRLSRGHGWRMFIVVAILPWLISEVLAVLWRGEATAVETAALTLIGTALFAVEIAALSLSYRELTKEDEAP
jgi:hypothetical protein